MTLSTNALVLQGTPTTPRSYEFGSSKNPYDYLPQAPAGRRGRVTDMCTDDVVSKKLLSKRIFLDLDDPFVPLFLVPRSRSSSFSCSSSNKKVKTTLPTFFSENDLSPSSLIHASLIRMRNGKSLQRLTEERESTAAGTIAAAVANDNTAVDTPNNGTITTENGEDDEEPIASAILSWKRLLVKGKETTKRSIPSGGVTLGKGVQRRDSGIARCA